MSRSAARPSGFSLVAPVVLAVLAGAGLATQSRINGTLADHVGSGYLAAVISFGSGLVLLSAALLVSRRGRAGMGRISRALRRPADGPGTGSRPVLRPWQCLGGAAGGFFVASQGLAVGTLGVALFIVAFVTGQSVGSLVVDRLGIGPGGVRFVTLPRAVGPLLTVVAVAIAMSGGVGAPAALALAVLPLLAGAGSAWQQAVNGRVRAAADDVLAATFVNFLVGTAALVLALGVSMLFDGVPDGALPGNPLLYTGGAIGIGFIAIGAAVVHRVGVLLLSLSMIAGQIVGALVLDVVVPGADAPGVRTYVGAALTLVAVAIPLAFERRGARPA
ncbi:DMT family transporter [Myceligenerans pegani]|uniref:DMT family transporter n=1 Tax=Myceligenerans pegani TaxID=2776917 RepID=A0ABR9MV78_9MICO|nr:DMT family transporter [Myceligenerans sp. TRM 65318]MBE1875293.1 DMT family transporter [Myceligenerans sp. TRM 65318]MBE3017564.1 DMT family transporter [Myceligenerans sp. TRM 65318]